MVLIKETSILSASRSIFVRARFRLYVSSLAEMQGRRLGSAAITAAVVETSGSEKIVYGDVVYIDYANDGRVISVHRRYEEA